MSAHALVMGAHATLVLVKVVLDFAILFRAQR